MADIITVANKKGGVGKSTTVVNVAASMGVLGQRILVVDMDPQGNATSGLGIKKKKIESSVYDVIIGTKRIQDCIIKTDFDNLSVLPSNNNLTGADIELIEMENRANRLKMQLLSVKDDYDFIIIDSPPSTSLITVNTLAACDTVLIPMQCEYYSLEGLSQVVDFIRSIKERYNPNIDIEGILFTMFDPRLNLTNQVADEVRKHFPKKTFDTVIPKNVRLSEAPSYGMPVYYYDKASKGSEAYEDLAIEILARHGITASPTRAKKETIAEKVGKLVKGKKAMAEK
ncbi:MAG: AAA family ATPase [Oscillospiraceae bacterium]|nr:AAA family ATPase [Oscillospiraceae bacterium]MDY2847629.1 AAA family ATPase [Oscillospiraceae bacterium]